MQTMTLKHQWHFFFNHHHIKMKIKSKQKPPMPPRHRQIEQQLSPSLPYKIHYRLIKLSEYEKLFPPTGIHKTGELHFGRRKVTEPSPGIPAGACLNFFLASTHVLVSSVLHDSELEGAGQGKPVPSTLKSLQHPARAKLSESKVQPLVGCWRSPYIPSEYFGVSGTQ